MAHAGENLIINVFRCRLCHVTMVYLIGRLDPALHLASINAGTSHSYLIVS